MPSDDFDAARRAHAERCLNEWGIYAEQAIVGVDRMVAELRNLAAAVGVPPVDAKPLEDYAERIKARLARCTR